MTGALFFGDAVLPPEMLVAGSCFPSTLASQTSCASFAAAAVGRSQGASADLCRPVSPPRRIDETFRRWIALAQQLE